MLYLVTYVMNELTMHRMAREATAPPPGLGPRASYSPMGGDRRTGIAGAGGARGGTGRGGLGWRQ